MGVLKSCTPRPEVLSGDLDDAIFAADFGELIEGRAPKVYGDPATFFQNTHPAAPLRKVVGSVFQRLANPTELGAVLRLSTGFGGGKTHTLMALWHLARSIGDTTVGTNLLPVAGRPSSVAVAAIDAGKAGTPVFAVHGTVRARSLWGEIAWQLGGAEAVAALGEADDAEAQPTDAQVKALFPNGPTLILLDELVIYMATLAERGQGNLLAFLTKLTSVVGSRNQTVLVVTDPADQRAYAKEAARLGDEITAAAVRLDDLIGRKASDFDPIGDEAAKVIVTRLFERIDPGAAHTASGEYFQLYSRVNAESPGAVPPEAATAAYAERIIDCYPFHPRLLDTAAGRLGALQEFNKSRGTLRLFARILRNVWEKGDDYGLISAGEIDWTNDRIQADLLQRLNRDNFKAAVHADIVGHAGELDEEWSTDTHTRSASALLLESIPNTESSGLTAPEIALATLRPSEAGPEPVEALERLLAICWHTYPLAGGNGAQFRYEPNVIKQIEQRMADIPQEDARSRVQSAVQGFFKGAAFKLVAWPTGPSQVPDSADLQLALCANEAIGAEVTAYEAPDQPRRLRNAIVAVAATPAKFADAIQRAQRLLAAEGIADQNKGSSASAKLVKEQLASITPTLKRQFHLQSFRAFDRVVLASGEVHAMEEGYLADEEEILAGPQGQAALRRFLDDKKLIYQASDRLDVDRFVELLSGATPAPGTPDAYSGAAVHERVLAAKGLRLVADPGVVRRSIQSGVSSGKVIVLTANGTAYDQDGCVAGPDGARRRTTGTPDTFPLDDTTLVTIPGSASAATWLKEDEQEGKEGGGATITPPPPPPTPPGKKTVDTWDAAIAAGAERPLERVTLIADTTADAKLLATIATTLGANEVTLDVVVQGALKGGGNVHFNMTGVKLTHPLKPIDLASGLATASDGAAFQAQLIMEFTEGRAGTADTLAQAAAAAPLAVRFKATFGASS